MRLKTKFSIVIASCVLLSVLATTYALSHSFATDQEAYLNELQAMVAFSIHRQLDARFGLLHSEMKVLVASPHFSLDEWAKGNRGVRAVSLWESGKLLFATPGAPSQPPPNGTSPWTLMESPVPGKAGARWLGRIGKKTVVLDLEMLWVQKELETRRDVVVRLITPEGHVFARMPARRLRPNDPELFENPALLKELFTRPTGLPKNREYKDALSREYLGTFLLPHSDPPYLITVRTPLYAIAQALLRTYWLSSGIAGSFLIIALAVGVGFSRSLTAPLQTLAEQNIEVSKGKLENLLPINEKRRDEIGTLAQSFRTMIRELRNTREDLRRAERMAAFGKFSAAIAHEIKNPIAGIIANAQVAKRQITENKTPAADFSQTMDYIVEEGHRASRIITKLMTFARQERSPAARINLAHHLKRSVAVIRSMVEGENARLEESITDEPVECVANTDEIHEVILNLIQNSVHAVRQSPQKVISVSLKTQGPWAEISISDTGHGVSPEVKEHIFEPFFTTKNIGEGTGLGLAVCHGIIKSHGGKISLQDSRSGTKFIILLPLAHQKTGDGQEKKAA